MFPGTVRRFLENHGENIETVVFAVSDVEEVCAVSFSLLRNRLHPLILNCALSYYYEIFISRPTYVVFVGETAVSWVWTTA